jgi:hypothetical protein
MVCKVAQIFLFLQHGQNEMRNVNLKRLFGSFLDKNKIPVCDFFSIERGQIDLENDIK